MCTILIVSLHLCCTFEKLYISTVTVPFGISSTSNVIELAQGEAERYFKLLYECY